jgi:hypothetical protein
MLREGDKFTVASLCKETGLSRAKLRRAFPTKAVLITAVLHELLAEARQGQGGVDPVPSSDRGSGIGPDVLRDDPAPASGQSKGGMDDNNPWPSCTFIEDEWIERRFHVVERAIAKLEEQGETRYGEHSCFIASLERRLFDVINAPLAAARDEPPPMVEDSLERGLELEFTENIQPAPDASPSTELASPADTVAPLGHSPSRLRLLSILEKARRPPGGPTAGDYQAAENPRVEFIVVVAAVFAALLTIAGLFWTHDRARATESPLAAARQQPREPNAIALIDATGNPRANPNAATPSASRLMAQANSGSLPAQAALAEAFLRGTGEETDSLAAARWSLAAAERGEPSAQFILGTLYSEGIKPNPHQALKWFFAAASRGNVKAMHNLGVAFLSGQGVARDPENAVVWFRRAANLGYRDSAFDLGVLYERGEGVSQNPQEALKWYDRASSAGDLQARQRASFLRSNLFPLAEK